MARRSERREVPRVEWNTPAHIRLPGRSRALPCIVHDLSNTGARITAANVKTLPDRFALELAKGSANQRNCLVRWRTKSELGVSFVVASADLSKPHSARTKTDLVTV